MNFNIRTVPMSEMRYKTPGDYWVDEEGVMQVRIADMGADRFNSLMLIHEITEILLVLDQGISLKAIDDFDMQYEREREAGWHKKDDEPGNSPTAPYHRSHVFAECIERLLASRFGTNWEYYGDAVNAL